MLGFKTKSYDEVTQQMQRVYYTELATEQLLAQVYQELSWVEWAYCVVELNHRPVCIAVGEKRYTVLRDGITCRICSFMLAGWTD